VSRIPRTWEPGTNAPDIHSVARKNHTFKRETGWSCRATWGRLRSLFETYRLVRPRRAESLKRVPNEGITRLTQEFQRVITWQTDEARNHAWKLWPDRWTEPQGAEKPQANAQRGNKNDVVNIPELLLGIRRGQYYHAWKLGRMGG